MKSSGEPNHLKGESLSPIIELIPKGNGQIDLPKWHGLFPGHDAMKRRSGWAEGCPVIAHHIERLGVHNVEAAASIDQHFGESFWADDWVNHKRISSRVWDSIQMVGPIEGYGGLRPPEEGRCGRLGRVGRRSSEYHKAAVRHRKAAVLLLGVVRSGGGFLP